MTRTFATNPIIPNIDEPIGQVEGNAVYLTDLWRQYFEQDNLSVFYQGVDLVKDSQDQISSLSTDYYTKAEADARYAAISHTHAASAITSGTFANARISQANVTQHQAALIITESQISDLGSYATTQAGAYTAAETAHTEPADFAAVKTALDALGTRINELQAKLVAAGIGA